jgi:Arc/MetJ-type ribon-helix-helix transcriptional regulator
MTITKKITIRIPTEIENRITLIAKRRKFTFSELTRELLRLGLDVIDDKYDPPLSRSEGLKIIDQIEEISEREQVLNKKILERICRAVVSSEKMLVDIFDADKIAPHAHEKRKLLQQIADQTKKETRTLLKSV